MILLPLIYLNSIFPLNNLSDMISLTSILLLFMRTCQLYIKLFAPSVDSWRKNRFELVIPFYIQFDVVKERRQLFFFFFRNGDCFAKIQYFNLFLTIVHIFKQYKTQKYQEIIFQAKILFELLFSYPIYSYRSASTHSRSFCLSQHGTEISQNFEVSFILIFSLLSFPLFCIHSSVQLYFISISITGKVLQIQSGWPLQLSSDYIKLGFIFLQYHSLVFHFLITVCQSSELMYFISTFVTQQLNFYVSRSLQLRYQMVHFLLLFFLLLQFLFQILLVKLQLLLQPYVLSDIIFQFLQVRLIISAIDAANLLRTVIANLPQIQLFKQKVHCHPYEAQLIVLRLSCIFGFNFFPKVKVSL